MTSRPNRLRETCWTALLLPLASEAAPTAPVGLSQIGQVIGALLLVVIAIFVVAALAQRVRRLQQGRGRVLQIVDGIALSARDRLVLVDVAGERLLLGVSPGRIERLHVLPAAPVADTEAAGAPAPVATPFTAALANARSVSAQEARS
ncbi:MAG: flagellar biosynthetic protein FliO [Gammaproteobacteria bacterium]|nr:flagellar biosynthetic protein FliO [Gammaproteobacteria bacterium]